MIPLNRVITALSFTLILSSFRSLFSAAKRTYCDPENRPAENDCDWTAIPTVCEVSYDCFDQSCRFSLPKQCACSYEGAEYYTSRPCQLSCKTELANCQVHSGLVCGTKKDPCGKLTFQTYKDACTACKTAKVEAFSDGVCATEEGYTCKGFDKIYEGDCQASLYESYVCGVKRSQDGKLTKVTYENKCVACMKGKVDTFTNGTCATQEGYTCEGFDQIFVGDCPPAGGYVCGVKRDQDGKSTKMTYQSKCVACNIEKVDTFTNGRCKTEEGYTCDGFDKIYNGDCPAGGGYVCGAKRDQDGKLTKMTYENDCVACNREKVDTFTNGRCETEERDTCRGFDQIDGDNCPKELDSGFVCGYKSGSNGEDVKITYESKCVACIIGKVGSLREGICETEEGYSCEGFNQICGDNYPKDLRESDTKYVCGMKKDSDGKYTNTTYKNICAACVSGKADVFSYGACEAEEGKSCQGFDEIYQEGCPKHTYEGRYVCGAKMGPDGKSTEMNYENECTACVVGKVDTFTDSICRTRGKYSCAGFDNIGEEKKDNVIEKPANFVCGMHTDSDGKSIQITYENEFAACLRGKVDAFDFGACKIEEDYSCKGFDEMYGGNWNCTKQPLNMVCGAKKDSNGKLTSKTYENACVACTQGKVSTYKMDKCVGDRGIMCDSHAKGVNCLEGYTMPVVGLGGEGSDYSKAFWNSCMACDDPSVKLYMLAYEFNCSDHRPASCPQIVIGNTEFLYPCGISKDGDMMGYYSPCLACEDPLVDIFTWCGD